MLWATKRTRFLIAGALLLALSFLFVVTQQSPESWTIPHFRSGLRIPDDGLSKTREASLSTPSSIPTKSSETHPCDGDGCFRGTWKARQPAFTSIDDLKPWSQCPSPPQAGVARTKDEQRNAGGKRLLDIMNWAWAPSDGILKEWDVEAFVIRLLRSPGGMIVVGDLVSQKHFEALIVSLNQAGISFDVDPRHIPQSGHKYIHQYLLKANDPISQHLFERAGVLKSRLERPILTLIEDGLLISSVDIRIIAGRLGLKNDYVWKNSLPQVDGWSTFVQVLASPKTGEEASVTEDTILLLNTGVHWSREHITLLKPRNNPADDQTHLTEMYRQMVRLLGMQVKPISRLSIFYRATTPGHPNCISRLSPYKTPTIAESMERNVVGRLTHTLSSESERDKRRKWDWDLFDVHNNIWRRATVRLERERLLASVKSPEKGGPKWHYLDVWSQALQRPDAHLDPAEDCLNWCSPALFDQWTRHIHHILQTRSEKSPRDEVSI